jgi:hypothetical protein
VFRAVSAPRTVCTVNPLTTNDNKGVLPVSSGCLCPAVFCAENSRQFSQSFSFEFFSHAALLNFVKPWDTSIPAFMPQTEDLLIPDKAHV